MTLLVKCLFPNNACADEMKETFCEAESVIQPYLQILANLMHGDMYAVNKVKQILWCTNERSMYMIYGHISHTFTIG